MDDLCATYEIKEIIVDFPSIQLVRQSHSQPQVADLAAETRRAFLDSKLASRIKPGMKIAVGCGSRGIRNYLTIAKATIDVLKELGTKPFVVAAMGSHGGATREGQAELLASYRIDEQHLGVPIVTDMDSKQIGTNSWNEPVFWDANALKADGVVLVARVKPHTDFRAPFESGLLKMAVIGLGKREGASQHHSWGTNGLRDMMPESFKVILENTPLMGGLAILENAQEETARLEVVAAEEVWDKEPPLLVQAREMMGRLPFDAIDVLIVGECGKNYSGAGIDPNVVGRMLIEASPEAETNIPRITRMACLDISPESHGNGTGLGIADLTTHRALAAIDPEPFRMNNLTARFLWRSKLPLGFNSDQECVQAAIDSCWNPIQDKLKVCIIPNTLEVTDMWLSPALLQTVVNESYIEVVGEEQAIPFDGAGNLKQTQLFPHCVRAKRHH